VWYLHTFSDCYQLEPPRLPTLYSELDGWKFILTDFAMATNKIQDLFNVRGLVVVITGGGSGLGLYAARALDANGAKAVYIIGRREETLREAAKTGVNGTIKPIVGDVSDKKSLQKIVDQIRDEQGFVNLLFANAGVSGPADNPALSKVAKDRKPSVKEYQDALWQPEPEAYTKALHISMIDLCSLLSLTLGADTLG